MGGSQDTARRLSRSEEIFRVFFSWTRCFTSYTVLFVAQRFYTLHLCKMFASSEGLEFFTLSRKFLQRMSEIVYFIQLVLLRLEIPRVQLMMNLDRPAIVTGKQSKKF